MTVYDFSTVLLSRTRNLQLYNCTLLAEWRSESTSHGGIHLYPYVNMIHNYPYKEPLRRVRRVNVNMFIRSEQQDPST